MANNRITYATAQFSVKDNRADATDKVLGWLVDGTLASGISAADSQIAFNEALSGVWPDTGQFRVKTGTNATEYIRYGAWVDTSTVGQLTRGSAGTTAGAHDSGNVAQLLGWEVPLGVQSVSIGTAFNTEDVNTLGQLEPYENIEGIPEIEITVERVFDGTKPLYLIVTDPDQTTLKGRTAAYRTDLAVSVYPDVQDSATGTPDSNVVVSGCYISSWSASFTADGNFTESVTLVSNDKTWSGQEGTPSGYFPTADAYDATIIGSGVQRIEDFDRVNSTLPGEIQSTDHIQSIDISVDIAREEIYELGLKTPFFRTVTYPVTVTTTFEVITDKGDLVNALGNGSTNLINRTIIVKTKEGLNVNLGTKNKLSNVTFEGFDAGGGNGTCTFEYTNSNALTITHTGFPDAFSTNTDNQ